MYGYIYITTNLVNGKKYIGQHKSEKFLGNSYLGSGIVLKESVRKYGKENFSVEMLEECYSIKELNSREVYWINFYEAVNSNVFYNLSGGGKGGGNIYSLTLEERLIIKETQSKRMTGLHHSDKTKEKISESLKGKRKGCTLKESTKKKMSEVRFGKTHKESTVQKYKNFRWINDGTKSYRIDYSLLDEYIEKGYKTGRMPFKRCSATTIENGI